VVWPPAVVVFGYVVRVASGMTVLLPADCTK